MPCTPPGNPLFYYDIGNRFQPSQHWWQSIKYKARLPVLFPSEVNMTPKRMLAGALLLTVVAQPSLSSPYVLMRQASPLLYPASYPSTSSQVTLNNGLYSPWSSFYYPSVINQRNSATAGLQAPAARATNTPTGPTLHLGCILNLVCQPPTKLAELKWWAKMEWQMDTQTHSFLQLVVIDTLFDFLLRMWNMVLRWCWMLQTLCGIEELASSQRTMSREGSRGGSQRCWPGLLWKRSWTR